MNFIPFPSQYKQALQKKTKNTTVRIKNEIGKYKIRRIYQAGSYSGKDFGIKIKVLNIIKTKIKDLYKHNIPKNTIKSIIKKEKVSPNTIAEIIKFRIL